MDALTGAIHIGAVFVPDAQGHQCLRRDAALDPCLQWERPARRHGIPGLHRRGHLKTGGIGGQSGRLNVRQQYQARCTECQRHHATNEQAPGARASNHVVENSFEAIACRDGWRAAIDLPVLRAGRTATTTRSARAAVAARIQVQSHRLASPGSRFRQVRGPSTQRSTTTQPALNRRALPSRSPHVHTIHELFTSCRDRPKKWSHSRNGSMTASGSQPG